MKAQRQELIIQIVQEEFIDTQEKLDKDRFRRDMGGVEEAYAEMMKRIGLA